MFDGHILADDSDHARWVAACSRERLAEQGVICAKVAGIDVIIVQDRELIYACERACPHEQADLSLGRVSDGRLHCPRHLAWFSLTDGTMSPGWPSRDLHLYPVRIDDTEVWIDSDAVRKQ